MPRPPSACTTLIVGGGILGLATAHEMLVRHPGTAVVLLERDAEVAGRQTAHNSGVIHAGVYYAPGSAKARLCVEGARRVYALCAELGVPAERCGKLIVAGSAAELGPLAELERRAQANGVRIERLEAGQIVGVEPHARGVAALHVPDTGIVDFGALARALRADVERRGGVVVTDCAVVALRAEPGGVRVEHADGVTRARTAIACAGAEADRLAVRSGAGPDPRIVPFRGAYFRLARPALVRALIYPVPDPALPFLGVHFTRRPDGEVLVGPTALPALARDERRRVRLRDVADTLRWPGTYRMAWRWRHQARRELGYAMSRTAYAREGRRLVPGLRADDLLPAFAGVRAQALSRSGALVDDFVFAAEGRVLHVRNAPSPAATSSPAIAAEIADRVDALGP